MGLDQYFLKTNSYDDAEIIYFRKYFKLNDFIQERFGTIENGGLIKLDIQDLVSIVSFIVQDRDSLEFQSYSDNEDYNHKYYSAIGILTHYIFTQEPLYYGSEW